MSELSNKILFIQSKRNIPSRILRKYKKVYQYGGVCKGVESLREDFLQAEDDRSADYRSGQVVDGIFEEYRNRQSFKDAMNLINDQRFLLEAKQSMSFSLAKIFLAFILAEKLIRDFGIKEEVDVIPADCSAEMYGFLRNKKGVVFSDQIDIPQWFLMRERKKENLKSRMYWLAIRIYPVAVAFTMFGFRINKERQRFKFGIHVWPSFFGSASESFIKQLLEENIIYRRQTLVVSERKFPKGAKQYLNSYGCTFCSVNRIMRHYSFVDYFQKIWPKIRPLLKLTGQEGNSYFYNESLLKTVRSLIRWEIFYQRFHVDQIISVQDPGPISRHIVQRQYDSRSTFVYLSSCYDIVPPPIKHSLRKNYYSYIGSDEIVSNTNSIVFFRENKNKVDTYHNVGILPADVVYRIKENLAYQYKIKNTYHISRNKKVIVFFDTIFSRMGWFTDKEMIQMLKDCIRLVTESPDCVLIYKPKADLERKYYKCLLAEVINQMESHKNIRIIPCTDKTFSSQEIMGVADLVVAAFSSSAGFEAISGGVKSMFYAPNDRFYDGWLCDELFPNFCAFNYDELKKHAHYWLYECNEGGFKQFQEKYIKPHVDAYCDGQALERFKQVLVPVNLNKVKTSEQPEVCSTTVI